MIAVPAALIFAMNGCVRKKMVETGVDQREVGRARVADDVDVALGIDGDVLGHLDVAAAEIRRVDQRRRAGRRGVELRDEGVGVAAAERRVERVLRREFRIGVADDDDLTAPA